MMPINVLIIETQQRTFNQTSCISISTYRKSDIPLSSSAERNNKRGNLEKRNHTKKTAGTVRESPIGKRERSNKKSQNAL